MKLSLELRALPSGNKQKIAKWSLMSAEKRPFDISGACALVMHRSRSVKLPSAMRDAVLLRFAHPYDVTMLSSSLSFPLVPSIFIFMSPIMTHNEPEWVRKFNILSRKSKNYDLLPDVGLYIGMTVRDFRLVERHSTFPLIKENSGSTS